LNDLKDYHNFFFIVNPLKFTAEVINNRCRSGVGSGV